MLLILFEAQVHLTQDHGKVGELNNQNFSRQMTCSLYFGIFLISLL